VTAVGLPPAAAGIATPGFVDLQVNGYRGIDALNSDDEAVARLTQALPATGVTAFALTLISAPVASIDRGLARIAAVRRVQRDGTSGAGATLLGAHLEGPFISPAYPGAHPVEHLRPADAGLVDRWLGTGVLVAVTMAPEVPGGADAITAFAAAGVLVSLGHCDATGAEASAAFDLGASALTHGLNAHRPLAAREPGPLGVALTRHDVVVTAIADGVHLDPINLALLHQAAPGRIALVTDGIVAAGLGDGTYRYGPLEVTVADGRATLGSGRLAGSVATMDSSVRTAAAQWGVEQALAAATSVPATLIGRPELGRIAVGQRADIAILDNQLAVDRTLCAGRTVFETPR
jgi:N-acetylglucosamine-6-phosphate deacetylase